MRAHLISLTALSFLAVAPMAAAQGFISRTLDDVGLTGDDYRFLRDAAASLYEVGVPEAGNAATWTNPKTGSYGTVEVTKFDGRCVSLKHMLQVGATKRLHKHESRRCKSEDGKWLLAPE